MARKTKTTTLPKEKTDSQKLVERIRTRYSAMVDADDDNRRLSVEDLRFCNIKGEQWDLTQKNARGESRCLEFNKVRPTVKRVVNEMRKNRPQGKVRAVEDGDVDTAETIEGLIRNIWNVSDADTVIDYAGEYQVGGGYGAWRITTKYADDSAFDQDIAIEAFKNPFSLHFDNACKDPLKRDARDWVVEDRISREVFKAKYPDADVTSFDGDMEDTSDWEDEESVRIVEYWWKEPQVKDICLLSSGETVDKADTPSLPEGVSIVKERRVKSHKIRMCIASGSAVLEEPVDWAGSQFPFIVIYGDWLVIDGKTYWSGITRHAKDAQRVYNTASVAAMEFAALQPKAKYWATGKQALGNTDQWAEANEKGLPALLYTPDERAPGPPQMMNPPPVPMAFVEMIHRSSDDIKAVTGIYDASLGAQGNETSGKAINARQAQGEVATYNFNDNMGKGIRRTYEILIDLMPKIIDTERAMRILGVDGAEKYIKVNQKVVDPATGEIKVLNDLSKGKFDTAVTIGPSYATARQESAEILTEIAARDPNFMPVAGDLLFKSMDGPFADQLADRYKLALLPQVQQQLAQDKPLPPEVQAAMQQVQMAQQQVQEHGQLVSKAEQELKQMQADVAGDKAASEIARANLKAEQIKLDAAQASFAKAQDELQEARDLALKDIAQAKEVLKLNEQIALLTVEKAHTGAQHSLTEQANQNEQVAQSNEQKAGENDTALKQLDSLSQQMQAVMEQVAKRPKITAIKRDKGALIPVYE